MAKNLGPEWVKDAVFYQIYPQSFCDTNGDGIGDLPGIIKKLDYIESLGVSAIWVNPCFISPFLDAGYDVADYYHVAPRYGTDADLEKLFREAKKRGIRVLLDLVPGHTSIQHPWFQASCAPEKNEFSNRYIWTGSAWHNGGAKWSSKMIQGFCDRDGSYMINYFCSQPALNFGFAKPDQPWQLPTTHPDAQATWQEMRNIMRYWLDKGASGFRVDMAGSIIRNDPGAKEAKRFWRETREMLDSDYPEAFIVSEWSWPQNALDAGFHADFFHFSKGYYGMFRGEAFRAGPGSEHFQTGASFFDEDGEGDASFFIEQYMEHYRKTKNKGYIAIPVGNHDIGRINNRRSKKDLEIIMAFLMTFPGTPFLYYGDEIGMRQMDEVQSVEGAYAPRKGARTPMQWTAGRNAGFSAGRKADLYLPVDETKNAPNVAAQEKRKDSLLNVTRELVKLRRTEPALAADAKFEVLYVKKNKFPLIFQRSKGRSKILVAFNPSKSDVSAPLAVGDGLLLAGSGAKLEKGRCVMQGRSYGIWKL
ncbi:MAG: glycosylase [Kiritimatiellaceae bacterium]|nr:glycosylase [Kiritimatiellaceae bacterium]